MKNLKTNSAAFINNYGELSNELGHGKTFATIDENGKVRSATGDFNSFYAETIEEAIEVLNEEIIPYMDFEERTENLTKKEISEKIRVGKKSSNTVTYTININGNEIFRNRGKEVYINGEFYDIAFTKRDYINSVHNLFTNPVEYLRVKHLLK